MGNVSGSDIEEDEEDEGEVEVEVEGEVEGEVAGEGEGGAKVAKHDVVVARQADGKLGMRIDHGSGVVNLVDDVGPQKLKRYVSSLNFV